MSKTISQLDVLNAAIIGGNFTNDQLTSIVEAVRYARSKLVRANTRAFDVGSRVKFTGRKRRVITGTITKIMIKNILVRPDDGGPAWRVPANMLSAA